MNNILYVRPRDEAHQAQLVEHYEFLGYYVKVVDGRIRVSSVKPQKPKVKKNDEKRNSRNSERESESVQSSERRETSVRTRRNRSS